MATSSSSAANTNFNDTQQLEQPIGNRENDKDEQVNTANPTKSFVCRLLGCRRQFPNKAALNFHRRKGHLVHFLCGLCISVHDDWTTEQFAFLGRDELEQHFRILHPGLNIRQQFSSDDHQRSPSSSGYESTDLQITSSSTTLEEIQKSQINLLQLELNNVETRLGKKQEELEDSLKKNMLMEKKLLKEKTRLGLLEREVADLKRKNDAYEANHNGQNNLEEDPPQQSGIGHNYNSELACQSQQCITNVQKLSQSLFEAEEKLAQEQKAHEERERKLEESIVHWKGKTEQLETKLSELELDKRESDRTILDKDVRLSYALERGDNLGSELKSSRTKISKLEEALKISNCKANVEREKYKNVKIKLDQIQAMQNKRNPSP